MARCSLRCFALALPALAVATAGFLSLIFTGRVWGLIPGWRVPDMPDQTGKVAIVTGPTIGGIGFETSLELARKGARVVMAGRNKAKGDMAVAAVLKEVPGASVEFAELDLASLASVRRFADEFIARKLPLHILVNNAAIMMNPFTLTTDGLESQFATNHLGHFLLTRLLLPVLEASAPARIVTVSSLAAYFWDVAAAVGSVAPLLAPPGSARPLDFSDSLYKDHASAYDPTMAYARSKLANVLFARALDRRVRSKGIASNACNPGTIATHLARHVRESSSSKSAFDLVFQVSQGTIMFRPDEGAVTQLFLASASEVERDGIFGQFYTPQALRAPLPPSVSDESEERLWELSERLVADFL